MKKFFKQKIIIFILTLLLAVGAEISLHAIIYHRAFSTYILFELMAFVIGLAPIFFFKRNQNSIIYSSIFFGAELALIFMSLTLDYCSGDIFSFNYISLVGEVGAIMSIHYINPWYVLLIALFVGVYVGGILLSYKFLKEENKKEMYAHEEYFFKGSIITVSLMLIGLITSLICLINIEHDYHDEEMYLDNSGTEIVEFKTRYFKKSALKTYGLLNYSFMEIANIFGGNNVEDDIKSIADYYSVYENPFTKTEDYKGLLKGYNVITIMIETGIEINPNEHKLPFGITKELTPTLYKLREEGLHFTNNLSKNKTNISEFIGINGSTTQKINTNGYTIPYSMPNVLNRLGYETSFFHDNLSTFYKRGDIIKTMGFDNTYFFEDTCEEGEEWGKFDGNYPLDDHFMEITLDKMVPNKSDKPFYTFYTTLSMHGPYNVGQKNIQEFKNRGYYAKMEEAAKAGLWGLPIKENPNRSYTEDELFKVQGQLANFQAEYMAFDHGVELLYNRLVETNQLDNTLLIFYGDHESYYMSQNCDPLKYYIYGVDNPNYAPQYQTIMFMYNPKLSKTYEEHNNTLKYNYFSTPYIIVPTVLELLGVNYNARTYVGTSAFQVTSSFDNLFYSHELSALFTENAFSDSYGEEFNYLKEGLSEDYTKNFNDSAAKMLTKIRNYNLVYKIDYFSQVPDQPNLFKKGK